MSRPVKEMIIRQYRQRFEDIEGALIISVRGVDANENNALRLGLHEQNIHVSVIKNRLARRALEGTGLEALEPALNGPSALAWGGESVVDVARQLVEWARKVRNLELRGAVLQGRYYDGQEGVRRLSEMPTQDEARAQAVTLVLAPGARLLAAATGPGSRLLAIVKEIQQRLENDQTITAAG